MDRAVERLGSAIRLPLNVEDEVNKALCKSVQDFHIASHNFMAGDMSVPGTYKAARVPKISESSAFEGSTHLHIVAVEDVLTPD